jgi:hypothetical protein
LEDSNVNVKGDIGQKNYFDWSNTSPNNFDWCQIHEGSYVYCRNNHNGFWAVKGYRLLGLDITISRSSFHNGAKVVMQRKKEVTPLVWEFQIDNVAEPFGSRVQRHIANCWGDRRNFQASFGLKVTPDDLKEGDAIIEALYDLWSSFKSR